MGACQDRAVTGPPRRSPRTGSRHGPGRPARTWHVLLLGGASGTGKTRLSPQIARHFGVGVTEVDDIVAAVERLTTPDQQPALHFWDTHPDPGSLSPEDIQRQGVEILDVLRPALEAVVENHLEGGTPVVVEGDFIHPALAVQDRFGDAPNRGRVRGVFLSEDDEAQLVRNFAAREPDVGPQTTRARVSALWSRWISTQCADRGVAVVPARPWDTLLARTLATLAEPQVDRRV